ncbi:MAG TPA: hypothetical protein DCQ06_05045, partial [Myxococcales bacterium]|nr:hypothetical protein [Myxococcales bacterium]
MKRTLLKPLLCSDTLKWLGLNDQSARCAQLALIISLSMMALTPPASAHQLPAETAWTLPAGQEAAVSKLLTIEGLPLPSSISIDKSRIIASYPGERELELRHPATTQGHKPLLGT